MSALPRRTILIVEDDPKIAQKLTKDLESKGFEVLCSKNGQEALEILKSKRAHTIISDIAMPEMSGLDLLYELRRFGNETPFIILTAFPDKQNMLKALRLGVNDFLDKPYETDSLYQLMERATQLGLELEKIDVELEELCKKSNIPNEIRHYFKRARVAPMIMIRDLENQTKASRQA